MRDDPILGADSDDNYLRDHPAYEMQLWQEWTLLLCARMSMAQPTGREWDALMKTWHHGKAPLDSVDELKQLRAATPNDEANRPDTAMQEKR